MRLRTFVLPVVGIACLASGVVPAAAQAPATGAPPAVATAAGASLGGALPADGDPGWSLELNDGFNLPHAVATDPADGRSIYTVNGAPVWKNIGKKPTADGSWVPRPIDECGGIDTAAGVMTLKPFPNDDPEKPGDTLWRCRITSTQSFGSGTYIFAARVKVHTSTGHLSSFWLNTREGAGPNNEIDVIENSGVKALANGCNGSATMPTNIAGYYGLNHTYYSSYTPKTGYKHCLTQGASTPLQDDQFHTFHVEWTPGQPMRFYADGALSATFEAKYAIDTPLTAILTNIDKKNAANPAKDFQVTWVKVWKKVTPPPPPASPCADNDYWRAQFGVAPYDFQPNSNPGQANQKRYVFDRIFYYFTYSDVRSWAQNKVATQGGSLWDHVQWHWLHYGIPQGRTGAATFDPIFYMNTNPDVSAAYGWNNYQGAIEHFVNYGVVEGRRGSSVFDATFYRSCYPDIASRTNGEVLDHFTKYGMDEGRQGSAEFAPAWYLAAYPDVRNAFGSNNYRGGMIHWISGGRGEGRAGHP